jgi:DNA-directed RNA polymerase subunit N (RpoN/RPB10)
MNTQNPEPQPPLYVCNSRCFTCGKVISNLWLMYTNDLKKLTSNEPTNIPIRTINTQKLLSDNAKTEEGKILDRYGVIRYCCRRMILSEPKNNTPII